MGIRSWWSLVQQDRVTRLRDIRPALLTLNDAPAGWIEYFEEVQGGPENEIDIEPCPEAAAIYRQIAELLPGCAKGGRGFRAPGGTPSLNQSISSLRDPERAFLLMHQANRTCVGNVRVLEYHGRPATTTFSDVPPPIVGEASAWVVMTADFDDGRRLQVDVILVRRGSVVQHYALVRKGLPSDLDGQLSLERYAEFVIAGDQKVATVLSALATRSS
jgi:hypothetical protein